MYCCQENRPPSISMQDQVYALENSEFQLPFNVSDPEGYPLGYSYRFDKTISSVSVDKQQQLVKISVKESGRVMLIVSDYEGLEDNHTIEIIAIASSPCSCQNGGKKHYIPAVTI